MSPPITPNPAFISPYPITPADTVVTVRPSNADDYDNLQYCLNQMAGKPNTRIELSAGTYNISYMLKSIDNNVRLEGAGPNATKFNFSQLNGPFKLLDSADQAQFCPTGAPDGITMLAPTVDAHSMHFKGIGFQSSQSRGFDAWNGFFLLKNTNMRSFFAPNGRWAITDKTVTVTFTGTTPQALGDTNVEDVQVWSTPAGAGVRYTEGVDYTLNAALGTVARIGTGAIPNGGPGYIRYNNIRNQNAIVRTEWSFENCTFDGTQKRLGAQPPYTNVDAAIRCWGGGSYARTSIPDESFHTFTYFNTPGYENLWFSFEGSIEAGGQYNKLLPLNAKGSVRNCRFAKSSLAVWTDYLSGVPLASPGYNFLPGTLGEAEVSIADSLCDSVGYDYFGFSSFFHDDFSTTSISQNNNRFVNCLGSTSVGIGEVPAQYLPGFVGKPAGISITADRGLFVPLAAGYVLPLIDIRRAFSDNLPPGDYDPKLLLVSNCTLEIVKPTPGSLNQGIFGIAHCSDPSFPKVLRGQYLNNRFINNRKPFANEAIIVGIGSNVLISGNDFSQWAKLAGSVDVFLTADSSDCTVSLQPLDLYRNAGTNNTVVGGIES